MIFVWPEIPGRAGIRTSSSGWIFTACVGAFCPKSEVMEKIVDTVTATAFLLRNRSASKTRATLPDENDCPKSSNNE